MLKRSFLTKLAGGVLATALIGLLVVQADPVKASASVDDSWAVSVPPGATRGVFADPLDRVYTSNCQTYSTIRNNQGVEVFQFTTPDANENVDFGCTISMTFAADSASTVVNDDGRIVSVTSTGIDATSIRVTLPDGTTQDSYPVLNECGHPGVITARPVVDNGVATYIYRSCLSSGWRSEYNLQAMNIDTGDVIFTTPLGAVQNTDALAWFDGGVTLNSWHQLRYFNTNGVEIHEINVNANDRRALHPNGDLVYFSTDGSSPAECSLHIESFTGVEKSEVIDCADQQGRLARAMPDGGVAILTGLNYRHNIPELRIIYGNGKSSVATSLGGRIPSYANSGTYLATHFEVDAGGNIVIGSRFDQDIVADGTPKTVQRVLIDVYSPDGVFKSRWNSASLDWDESFDIDPYGYSSLGLAQNAIYVGSDVTSKVARISAPGISLPYRDAVRWDKSVQVAPEPLKYVALGDSFSSGEGLRPYIGGTDTNMNKCHRSKSAWPYIISESLGVNIELEAFVACQGAVLHHIENANTSNHEPFQLGAISEDTDIVSITIGGNDIGFEEFVFACLTSCSEGGPAYNTALTRVNDLSGKLEDTYKTILREMAPSASLYVIGYPHVMAPKSQWDVAIPACPTFYLGSTPWGNGNAAYDIAARLNAQIELSVHNVRVQDGDERIHFVDVNPPDGLFTNHDACSTDPYVFNLDPLERTKSLHPNEKGHEAITKYVRAKL